MKTTSNLSLSTFLVIFGLLHPGIGLNAGQAADSAIYNGLTPGEFMRRWLILAPLPVFPDESRPDDEAVQRKAFNTDWLSDHGGESGAKPGAGANWSIGGKDYDWRLVESKGDIVNFLSDGSTHDFAIAYAYAEIEMSEDQTVPLGLGSDDAVKVWLNGQLVHENWAARPVARDDDLFNIKLVKGTNRLLVKVQNLRGDWGFVCRRLGPESMIGRLVLAVSRGNLDAVKLCLTNGVSVSGRYQGLTPLQAAWTSGQKEIADFLIAHGADTNAPLPEPQDVIDATLREATRGMSSGIAVLVARNGNILFQKGYGYASIEHEAPVTPETKFRIGSITKQFTAAAILRLKEQGKLTLNDTLTKFIPDYPRGGEVTLHHLLTHTSGIHSYTSKPDFLATVTVPVKTEEHIKSFKDDAYDFAPGQKWLYNNSGFFLLGYIVEKVSGKSYSDFLRDEFFGPLGMTNTGVHTATAILKEEATGYAYENGELRKALNWDMSRAGGAGALYSTVTDLFRWNEALFNGKVLDESSLKLAFTPVVTTENADSSTPKETGYGYGWAIEKLRGLRSIEHGGGLHGFLSYLLRLPDQKFTVCVLANASDTPQELAPGSVAHRIVDLYYWRDMKPREAPKQAPVDPKTFIALVGRYDYGNATLVVTQEGDHLYAQLSGQPKFEIFPKSEDTFFWKVVEAEVQFVKNEKGEVTKAIHRQGSQTINAPRLATVKEVELAEAMLESVAGKYDYGDKKSILTVTREGSHLFAQLTGQPKFEIFPKSETEFFWKVVAAQVTFVKDANGKVTKAVHEQGGRKFDAPRIE